MYDMPFPTNATKLQQQQGNTDSLIVLNRVLIEYVTYKTEESRGKLTTATNVHILEYEKELRVLYRLSEWCKSEKPVIQLYKPVITQSYMETHLLLLNEQVHARILTID